MANNARNGSSIFGRFRPGQWRSLIQVRYAKGLGFSLALDTVVLGLTSVVSASDDTFTLSFNAADQLAAVGWQHGALADFAYDGDGLRISKTVGTEEIIYVRDASGEVLAEYDQDGTLLAECVYAGGRRVCTSVPGIRTIEWLDMMATGFGDAGWSSRGRCTTCTTAWRVGNVYSTIRRRLTLSRI